MSLVLIFSLPPQYFLQKHFNHISTGENPLSKLGGFTCFVKIGPVHEKCCFPFWVCHGIHRNWIKFFNEGTGGANHGVRLVCMHCIATWDCYFDTGRMLLAASHWVAGTTLSVSRGNGSPPTFLLLLTFFFTQLSPLGTKGLLRWQLNHLL